MSRRQRHADLRLYLPHALAATLAVVVLPGAVALGVSVSTSPDPSATWLALAALVLSGCAAVLGSMLWGRRPESVDISFGELMIWAWYRRKRAEQRLVAGERLLTSNGDASRSARRLTLVREQRLSILHDLIWALETKDPYTHGHSRRVRRHVRRMASVMGLGRADVRSLGTAGALHDVGKIRVPHRILRKPSPLTIEEQVLLRDHTYVGAGMVAGLGDADLTLAVRHHHERWDGTGYPDGLVGDAIPLFARIISVADAFDAMTSSRPYRASLGREKALEVIGNEAGAQFDPAIVEVFMSTLTARLPVPIFLPLLAWPRRFFRELAAHGTHAGTSSLASATSAVGVAVLLGASTLSPSTLADRPLRPEQGGVAAGAVVPHVMTREASTLSVKSPPEHERAITRHDARTERSVGASPPHSNAPPKKEGPPSPQAGGQRTDKPDAKTRPEGQGGESMGVGPTGDPQLEQGRDCIGHPGQGAGGGNDTHCDQ